MAGLGWQELLLILGILVLLFGATRLPKLARSMGQSVRGFKKGMEEDAEEESPEIDEASAETDEEKDDAVLASGEAPPSTSS